MGTMHVYGFAHRDLRAARKAIESALSICMEEAKDSDEPGYCFRWYVPDGPCVQILSNYGTSLRWGGDLREAWHPCLRDFSICSRPSTGDHRRAAAAWCARFIILGRESDDVRYIWSNKGAAANRRYGGQSDDFLKFYCQDFIWETRSAAVAELKR